MNGHLFNFDHYLNVFKCLYLIIIFYIKKNLQNFKNIFLMRRTNYIYIDNIINK